MVYLYSSCFIDHHQIFHVDNSYYGYYDLYFPNKVVSNSLKMVEDFHFSSLLIQN